MIAVIAIIRDATDATMKVVLATPVLIIISIMVVSISRLFLYTFQSRRERPQGMQRMLQ